MSEFEPPGQDDYAPVALVVLSERPGYLRDAVLATVEGAGFEVVGGPVSRALDALQVAVDLGPAVVVLDVGQAGAFGVRLVSMVRTAVPDAHVVVVVPFEVIGDAARLAGADDVFLEADLRGLADRLSRVASVAARSST